MRWVRSWATSAGIAVAAAVVGGLLAGCGAVAPAPRTSPPASAPPASAPSSESSSSEADLPDARAIRGPSTARTVTEVVPVAHHAKPGLPTTVTDRSGAKVTVRDAGRILALDIYGTIAETVVGLGLGERLVGRAASNTLSSMAALPLVTRNGHDLNVEAIVGLRPTLILTDTTVGSTEIMGQLRGAGATVVQLSSERSLATVAERIREVAEAVALPTEGAKLAARAQKDIDAAERHTAALAPERPLRIAFLYIRGQAGVFFVFGRGMGADDLITSLRGQDVATELGVTGAQPANAEALAKADPEAILVMSEGLASGGGVDGLLKRPGVAQTRAGANRRIVDMADGQILSFGPTTGAVVRSLADALYRP